MNSTKAQQQYQKAKWAALIKDQQQSTLKVKDWLKANDVSKDQFYYWKRKLKDEVLDDYVSSFVELPTLAPQNSVVSVAKFVQHDTTQITTISPLKVASINIGASSIDIFDNASASFLHQLIEVIAGA